MTRIEKAHLYPVAIPLNHPYKSATRTTANSEDIVVKLTTADGATGWGAADIVNLKVNREGGLLYCKKVAALIEVHGIEGMCGCVIHSALNDVASAHLFASTPATVYNESGKAPAWHEADIITGFEVSEGVVKVPEGPGLGVEVNEEAPERFRADV